MKLGNHTLTRRRAGEKSSGYGTKTVPDWDNPPPDLDLPGCSVQPLEGSEDTDARDSTTTRWKAWIPGNPDLTAFDHLLFQGDEYDIEAKPDVWAFPPDTHCTVILRRSEDQ